MRPVPALAALVLLLAGVPFAAGNAPPVALAAVQAEAVLGEPVLFASESVDPDGTIVATTWEFSDDGRVLSGERVTKVLPFAGLHTVILRVRDDLGAVATAEVQVLVHAPLMMGRAVAVRAGDTSLADTGDVVTTQQTRASAADGEVRNGQLRAARLASEVQTVADHQGPRVAARADAGYVYIPVPIGYILLTGVEAESIVGCTFPTLAASRFTQLRLNDAPLVPPGEVAPGTIVAVPGVGTITLNAQERTEDGRLAVTAFRLVGAGGNVVEVARAEAGVDKCPHVGAAA